MNCSFFGVFKKVDVAVDMIHKRKRASLKQTFLLLKGLINVNI